MAQVALLQPKWRKMDPLPGTPKPRHGHRAVTIRDMMIVFGGGSEGIIDTLNVFRSSTNQWFTPSVKGEVPAGCAAFGFCTDGSNRVFLCGGMLEYGKYSNDIYELKISTWEWKKIAARKSKNCEMPKPRLGHSFTLIGTKLFLFGGLANQTDNPRENCPVYLNDLYTIEIKSTSAFQQWEVPVTYGTPPSARESHSATVFTPQDGKTKLMIYGGMNGNRLGDFFILDIGSMTWSQPTIHGIPPLPRSLHSASVINRKLYIFGGWVPSDNPAEGTWKCSNSLSILNLETLTWEHSAKESYDERCPPPRAGHVGAAIGARMFLWSGREGVRKSNQPQFCYSDLWFLETEIPHIPVQCQLKRANASALDISWTPVLNADCYLVQIMKVPAAPPCENVPPTPTAPIPMATPGTPYTAVVSQQNQPYIPDPSIYAAAKKLCLPDLSPPVAVTQIPVAVSHSPVTIMSPQPIPLHPVSTSNIAPKLSIAQSISGTVTGVPQPISSQMPKSTITPIMVPGQLGGMQALVAAAEQTGRLNTTTKVVHVQHPQPQQIHQSSSGQQLTGAGQPTTPGTVRIISPQTLAGIVRPSGSNIINVGTPHSGQTPIGMQPSLRLISAHHLPNVGAKPMVVKASPSAAQKMGTTIKSSGPLIKVLKPGEIVHSPMVSAADSAMILNRPGNVGKIVSSGPGGVKMLVYPTTSATTPTSSGIQAGKRIVNPKMITMAKPFNIRQLTPGPIRLLQQNGAQNNHPRYILHLQTSNQIQTSTRHVVPTIVTTTATAPPSQPQSQPASSAPPQSQPASSAPPQSTSTSDADMLIDNQTAPPEEISTVIPQVDGAESDIEQSDNKPKESDNTEPKPNDIPTEDKPDISGVIKNEEPTPEAGDQPPPEAPIEPALKPEPESDSQPRPVPPKIEPPSVEVKPPSPEKKAPAPFGKWFDVAIVRTPKCNITGFYFPPGDYDPERTFTASNVPSLEERYKYPLDPATHYKIRICGINELGRGTWSEELVLQTYIPGFPTAPSQIRITKQADGAQLIWASSKNEEITEYTVVIAVRANNPEGLAFEKIYSGTKPQCFVSMRELQESCIYQNQEKPVVIFRVSARNSRGTGPQTQVKWLMDCNPSPAPTPVTTSTPNAAFAKKRPLPNE